MLNQEEDPSVLSSMFSHLSIASPKFSNRAAISSPSSSNMSTQTHPANSLWCMVSQPNGVVLEVDLDVKAIGQDCLNKVCDMLGILETDFFSLQYQDGRFEYYWLNLRNRISRQVTGPPPYRFSLRVKFYVQPHLLLQETTRHQVYLNLRQKLKTGELVVGTWEHAAKLGALIAQAELGDFAPKSNQHSHYSTYIHDHTTDEDYLTKLARYHKGFEGISTVFAEYRVIQESAKLEGFGVEKYQATTTSHEQLVLGIGPDGVSLIRPDTGEMQQKLTYQSIRVATHQGHCLLLSLLQDDGEVKEMGFRLSNQKLANGLYRCVTEMHSFYRCDTVGKAVTSQYSRDLKGTIASIFSENTTLGRDFVFDVTRTCKEAVDRAQRLLYGSKIIVKKVENEEPLIGSNCSITSNTSSNSVTKAKNSKGKKKSRSAACTKCVVLTQKVNQLEEELACVVCRDTPMNTVFCPCGHIVCCTECAKRLESCPICRTDIEIVQKVFLPNFSIQKSGDCDKAKEFNMKKHNNDAKLPASATGERKD